MTWRDAAARPSSAACFPSLEKRLGPARKADEPLSQRHHNLAASMQAALEEVLVSCWKGLAAETGQKSLCLAGGVAFNCVANAKVLDEHAVRASVRPAGRRRRRTFRGRRFRGAARNPGPAARIRHGTCLLGPGIFRAGNEAGRRQRSEAPAKRKSPNSTKPRCWNPPRATSPPEKSSAGFRAPPNGDRALWAIAASWPTRAVPK